jgi:membrane protease YdiL (CAAX protease family)
VLPGPTASERAGAPKGRVCKSGWRDVAVRQRDRGFGYWVTILVTCVAVVLLTEHLPFAVGLVIGLALGALVGLILRWQRRLR